MPTYDWICDGCGDRLEVIVPVGRRNDDVMCERCAAPMRRIITAGKPHGILPSKPLVIPHAAAAFTTNKQFREYEKGLADEGMRIISAKSKDWEAHHTKVRNLADKRAKARGFDDFDDQSKRRRKETATRAKLKREKGKVAPTG